MNTLILGGGGFIGCGIASYLLENTNYNLTIADNFFRQGGDPDQKIQDLEEMGVKIVSGDFTDPRSFDSLELFDQIYMLAAVVGVDYVNSIPHEIIRINSMLIINTLEWIRKKGCGRVLFSSTSEAYAGAIEQFDYKIPTSEEVPLVIQDISHPRFTYAVTKMLGESGFINYGSKLDFESVIVRYHNVYGPRMGFKHVIPHLAQRFTNGENPFKVYGHNQTRSFNFIDDAVRGTVLAMENGGAGEIYHIGDTKEISIEELVRFVGKIFDFEGEYEYAPTYAGSVARRCPDIGKAKKDLGYTTNVDWKVGVEKTINWYRQYLSRNKDLHESFYDRPN